MTTHINLSIDGRVAVIELNRPEKLNAMTPEMADQLVDAVAACNADGHVRAVVLTGAGPKSFCAGSDIAELDTYETPWAFRNRREYCDCIRALKKPAIAAINGYAFGGGLEMALACDIRIASDNARLGAPEIKLGWIGGGGVTAHLVHAIGQSNAAWMILTGEPIRAEQALAWGLVSEVTAPEALRARALELAGMVAARAPIAAETARANLRAAVSMPLDKAIEYERDLQTICFATEDAMEGRRAFKEKRTPEFKGR